MSNDKIAVAAVAAVSIATVATVGFFGSKWRKASRAKKTTQNEMWLDEIRSRPDADVECAEVQESDNVVEFDVKSNDVVTTVVDKEGDEVASISRIRVPEQEVVEVVAPLPPEFWTSFKNKIKRPDVIDVVHSDFLEGVVPPAKGFHHCTMYESEGILHATKSHISVVVWKKGEFVGLSTSIGRFSKDVETVLSNAQVKNFLSGR